MKHPIADIGRIALVLFLFSTTSSLILVKPAWAQSSPSIPEFTVKLENGTLEVTIKNQPFVSYNDSGWKIEFFYDIRMKGHFSEEWMELYRASDGYPTQSGNEYTEITLGSLGEDALTVVTSAKMIDLPIGAQVDFQVQAMTGYVHRVYNPNATNPFGMYAWVFTGETSGWSITQTVIIEGSPQPSTTPTPTANATSTPPPEPTPTQPPLLPDSSFSDDFSSDSGAWQYLGSTYRDQTNQYLVLTNSGGSTGGVAFFNAQIQGSFTASFSYKSDGGDGFTLFFYKQKYSTIDTGGSLSFSSPSGIVPGYGIEFDSWQNIPEDFQSMPGSSPNAPGDPSNHHIALIEGYVGNHLTYADDQRVADNNWHNVSVSVQASSVRVFVDGGLVLQWNGMLNRTYAGFGFSGANGSASGWHIIDNFSIGSQNLQKPSLITSCRGSSSASRFSAQINGNLTFNGTAVSGVPIFLSYSVNGGKSFQELTLVNTGSDGSYSALWLPSVTGNYMIKAIYEGNESYLGAINIVNFAIKEYTEGSVFSVTTNSTLSELSFNSNSKELSFSVSGDNGTTGYVDVYIPKFLINDITGLKVYFDSTQIEFSPQSQSDFWYLHFTYHHSIHSFMINLGSPIQQPTLEPAQSATPPASPIVNGVDTLPYIIGMFAAVIAALVVVGLAVYFVKFRKETAK